MHDAEQTDARPNHLTRERLRFLHADLGFSRDDLERLTGDPRPLIDALLERFDLRRFGGAFLTLTADDVRGVAQRLGCSLAATGTVSELCSHLRQEVRMLARHGKLDWNMVDDLAAEAYPRGRER